jgi:hypothetical protein
MTIGAEMGPIHTRNLDSATRADRADRATTDRATTDPADRATTDPAAQATTDPGAPADLVVRAGPARLTGMNRTLPTSIRQGALTCVNRSPG